MVFKDCRILFQVITHSGGSLDSLEPLNSLESPDNGPYWETPFSKDPYFWRRSDTLDSFKGHIFCLDHRGDPVERLTQEASSFVGIFRGHFRALSHVHFCMEFRDRVQEK